MRCYMELIRDKVICHFSEQAQVLPEAAKYRLVLEGILGRFNPLNMSAMIVSLIGDSGTIAHQLALELIKRRGHTLADMEASDVAVAPLLNEIIPYHQLSMPIHGTLIFHPSPLPYGRGAAAIKHAHKRNEPITAATWFWANDGKVDSGDICEMEIVKIDQSTRPRLFYEQHILPAMLRTLDRCLSNLSAGIVRRVPQVEEYSSFDYR